jgi:dipeptidyl aminopeptidase/acylaminoacyl peptidase
MVRPWLTRVAAALWLLSCGSPAGARPFTVDDLLHQESLGAAAIDPGGRRLVFEQRDRYDTAARFEYHFATSRSLGRLRVVDLGRPGPSRPLLSDDPGPGIVIGSFSPSGDRLAVYRLHDRQWTLGIVTLATGEARWFDVTPQETGRGRTLQWISDTELLVIVRPDRLAPAEARQGWIVTDRLAKAWASVVRGDGAHDVLGSGAYASVRRRAPLKQLLRVDAVAGLPSELARGEFIDLELSPDRTRVALFESGPDIQPRADGPVRGPAGFETEVTRLSILELRTKRVLVRCCASDLLPNLLAWSPSGRSLLLFARGEDALWSSGHLLKIDTTTGMARVVGPRFTLQQRLNPVAVRAGWMGEDPLACAVPGGAPAAACDWFRFGSHGPVRLSGAVPAPAKAIVASDAQGLVVIAAGRLWRLDRRGRARDLGAKAVALAARAFAGAEGSRLVNALPEGSWVLCGPAGHRQLAWIQGGRLEPGVERMPAPAQLATASRQARAAVTREIDPHGVERLTLLMPHAPPIVAAEINADLRDTDAPSVRQVHHLGQRGEPLTSWLYLPASPAGAGPPPLIVRPYLGHDHPDPPRPLYMESGFFENLRLLTAHGYAVLVPSLPNPPGGLTDPAGHVADRILAIVQAAQEEPGLAGAFDPSRMAILGWSFGGYTTMAVITQTDRFRAAVEMDGISDLVAYWSGLSLERRLVPEEGYGSNWSAGTVEWTQPELHVPPWRDLDRYLRNSPLLAADRIHTPLLLIHGALDPIPSAGSEAMFSALFRQSKDAILVTYWGANHGVTSPGDVRDVYARTFAFLDEHLTPAAGRGDGRPEGNRGSAPASDAPRPPPSRP